MRRRRRELKQKRSLSALAWIKRSRRRHGTNTNKAGFERSIALGDGGESSKDARSKEGDMVSNLADHRNSASARIPLDRKRRFRNTDGRVSTQSDLHRKRIRNWGRKKSDYHPKGESNMCWV